MSEDRVLTGIRQVAETHLGHQGPLDPEAHLIEDLGLDSIRLLTLAVEVENHFQVCLEPEDEAEIATVADLARIVRSKLDG